MIVGWGLAELPGGLEELPLSRPLLISTGRWRHLQLPGRGRFHGVRAHAKIAGIKAAREAAGGADGLITLGGGSAIDTAKAVSSQTGLPVVSIPATCSGAEWTSGCGMRDAAARTKPGGGDGRAAAIGYEVGLTLGLPARAGTAMNALAHCAEARCTTGRAAETGAEALAGAPLISRWLPVVTGSGRDLPARRGLLEGAMHAGAARRAGVGAGPAIAQEPGGRYRLAHETMNAVSRPAALRVNSAAAAGELARSGEAIGRADPIARVSELAALAGPARLRDDQVPRQDLPELAQGTAGRPAAKANPRPAPPGVVLELLEQMW